MEALRETERRRSLADHYFENFRRYYEEKNLPKASEFLWGALNALAYALGLFYGRKLGDHEKVESFLMGLARERRDKEMLEEVLAARRIHANFYHAFMDEDMFEVDKDKVINLLERLARELDERVREEAGGRRL
jgi:hypothetical protein